MAARFTDATLRAIAAVQAGATPYRAAKDEGINPSTLYRALDSVAALAARDQAATTTPNRAKAEAAGAIAFARARLLAMRDEMGPHTRSQYRRDLDEIGRALDTAERAVLAP